MVESAKTTTANPFKCEGNEYSTNIQSLRQEIESLPYVQIEDQPSLCQKYDLDYMPTVFQSVYRKRFLDHLVDNVTTCAMVSKDTGLPQKYLTWLKWNFEKKGLIAVVGVGNCPLSGRRNVQFLTAVRHED